MLEYDLEAAGLKPDAHLRARSARAS
jgi:hypothetical protein